MTNPVLIFDIEAKFASFRKIDTNSSSLSYKFPPKTTIMGIIGAILGLEKDSYYNIMDNTFIGVRILQPSRSMFQSVNNVMIKHPSDLNFLKKGVSEEHTIVPIEILVPYDWNKKISFRIYYSDNEIDKVKNCKKLLKDGLVEYPVSLGYANMLANVIYIGESQLERLENSKEILQVNSPLPLEGVENIEFNKSDFSQDDKNVLRLNKDLMPFSSIDGRRFRSRIYLFEENGRAIPLRVKSGQDVYITYYLDHGEEVKDIICSL